MLRNCMLPSFMIFDNFYANPLDVRNHALSLPFDVTGNYPGKRTKPLEEPFNSGMKDIFEGILRKKVTWWPEEYNTSYQYTTKNDITWVHYDPTMWAAVLYLTPDAPLEAGTAIYRHKKTNLTGIFIKHTHKINTVLSQKPKKKLKTLLKNIKHQY